MIPFHTPWLLEHTVTGSIYCPWSNRQVTVRYLVWGGGPVGVIGCSERDCSLACLAEDAGWLPAAEDACA